MDNKALKSRYYEFNAAYFGSILPDMPVTFAKLKGVGGDFRYKVKTTKLPFSEVYVEGSGSIRIDSIFLRSQEKLDGLLLHEMVHAYMAVTGHVRETHGAQFEAKRAQVERMSGIEIPRTESIGDLKLADQNLRMEVGVILIETQEGRYSAAIVAPARFKKTEELADLIHTWDSRIRYKIVNDASAWLVTSEVWTTKAMSLPIQRKALSKVQLYKIDESLVKDLHAHGKLVSKTSAKPITDKERDAFLKNYPLT
jgi:hypothetical protein